jgi:hypothetical protein
LKRHGFSARTILLARSSLFAAALAGLSGCPQGADLEDPERFAIGDGTTGGTSSTGGSGGGSTGCSLGLTLPISCDWQTGLTKSCAISSCHGKVLAYAELLLTVDECLFDRLKDVTGTIGDVNCGPIGSFDPCETPPSQCQHLVGKKLVDSANPDESLLLKKLEVSGCGNQMPIDPGNSTMVGWGPERLDCLQQMVRAIAALPPP